MNRKNQFPPPGSLTPEQLSQLQNLAAIAGLGPNNNLNPMGIQNLLNPLLGVNLDQTIRLLRQQQEQQQQQQQQQLLQQELTQRLQQQLHQIVQQSQRQQQVHPSQTSSAGDAANLTIRQQQVHPSQTSSAGNAANLTIRQQQVHPSQTSSAGDAANLTIRQQRVHHSQASSAGDAATLTIRQQQALQSAGSLPIGGQQKRKRGRPPLSGPTTSSAATIVPVDFNYLNLIAVKNQQERNRLQRETKIQQDRQREMRKQQELDRAREMRIAQERAERQRELRLQQERERQRIEIERQRKAQHRLALQDIDRERRRQHMIMVRNLDAYRRNEEREKTMNAMVAERNKQLERRIYQKRLEAELLKEIKKPVDDMMLKNHKPLATLNRIPGLKLPGKAFADLLMSYEFLHNFGETIGLEIKELPNIDTLQLGLLNLNTWAEDQFISTLHYLCMFAIKDPRFPYTGSLKEIESLDRTNEGLSQLLHFYLQVLTLNAKTEMEHEYRLYKLIEQKYFLSLNATQKAEMLAFICNELLCSQTVTKQMEDTIENVAKLRKDKWVLENELRKYRAIKTKREFKEEEMKAKEAALIAANSNGESEKPEEDGINDNKSDIKKEDDDRNNKSSLTNGSTQHENATNKRENDSDTSLLPNNTADLDDLEPGMTNEELSKKLDNLTRQYNKTSNKLERAINSMRACPLGQDRFRRRYWVLPQVGGVFVEGIESSEPDELENNKFTEEELAEYEREMEALNQLANDAESTEHEQEVKEQDQDQDQDQEHDQEHDQEVKEQEKMEVKEEKDDDEINIKEDAKDEDEAMDIREEDAEASAVKEEVKMENGEPESCVHKDVPETVEPPKSNCDEVANPQQLSSSPWFSILPRKSCDFKKNSPEDVALPEGETEQKEAIEEENPEVKAAELTSEELKAMRHDICPALAKRLEDLEAEQYESPRKIHPQFQYGWWRITDAQQLKSILSVLHERGSREKILHKHLSKHFQYACNSCKNNTVDFEITSYDRQLAGKNYGAPMPHTDDDSADDLKEGEEVEEEEEEELDEETGDDKAAQQAAVAPSKKSKRKKTSRSARSRRLRARAAARKKVENSKNRLAQI